MTIIRSEIFSAWLGESLESEWHSYPADFWLEQQISIPHPAVQPTTIGLRLRRFMPGGIGDLGVEYLPANSNTLTIQVAVSTRQHPYPAHLLSNKSASVVLETAIQTVQQVDYLGSGMLCFRWGMEDVFSGEITFQVLAHVIIQLLNPAVIATETTISDLIESAYGWAKEHP